MQPLEANRGCQLLWAENEDVLLVIVSGPMCDVYCDTHGIYVGDQPSASTK